MHNSLTCSLPESIDRRAVLEQLDRVLDPELDESILQLGFVRSIHANRKLLTVTLRLPTYWCAPNFSYLMVADVRRRLLTVENVCQVQIRLEDHFASEEIERAVNANKSFEEAFPAEASENLDQLRVLFLRKGYLKRQEALLRSLRDAGLSSAQIAPLLLSNLQFDETTCWLARQPDRSVTLGCASLARRYLQRRAEIGIDMAHDSPLMVNLLGQRVAATDLEQYFIYARTVRVSLDANGSLCCALLAAQRQDTGTSPDRPFEPQ